MLYGVNGQLLNETLMDYNLPKADQVPSMETIMLEIPAGGGPFGAKGIGEPPIVPGAASIANAIAAATGKRFLEMPVTPETVVKALNNGSS
jgi:CO/xanthine dehydrogenase Mo-binding subunit